MSENPLHLDVISFVHKPSPLDISRDELFFQLHRTNGWQQLTWFSSSFLASVLGLVFCVPLFLFWPLSLFWFMSRISSSYSRITNSLSGKCLWSFIFLIPVLAIVLILVHVLWKIKRREGPRGNPQPTCDTVEQRRRTKTEEKAKVVAAFWGTELIQ